MNLSREMESDPERGGLKFSGVSLPPHLLRNGEGERMELEREERERERVYAGFNGWPNLGEG